MLEHFDSSKSIIRSTTCRALSCSGSHAESLCVGVQTFSWSEDYHLFEGSVLCTIYGTLLLIFSCAEAPADRRCSSVMCVGCTTRPHTYNSDGSFTVQLQLCLDHPYQVSLMLYTHLDYNLEEMRCDSHERAHAARQFVTHMHARAIQGSIHHTKGSKLPIRWPTFIWPRIAFFRPHFYDFVHRFLLASFLIWTRRPNIHQFFDVPVSHSNCFKYSYRPPMGI